MLYEHVDELSDLEPVVLQQIEQFFTSGGPGRWPGQNWKGTATP